MKAHVPDPDKEKAMQEAHAIQKAYRERTVINSFILGGHSAMRLAADRFGDRIRNATEFEELKAASLELLEYLTEKSEGLKKVAEDKPE